MSLRPVFFCSLLAAPFFLGAATVPLHFEAAANGSLVAREGPYNLAVESGRTTVTIGDRANHRSATVVTRLAGAERSQPTGEEPMAAKASYFLNSDAASWRTGVPLYSRAVERDVYRGIDLVFHGDSGSLEYDFLVHPDGNARQIALDISGAAALRVEPDGSLVIATSAGEIRWNKPVVYQWKDGARRSVAGAFALYGHRVTFALGDYDRARDLVIDPTLKLTALISAATTMRPAAALRWTVPATSMSQALRIRLNLARDQRRVSDRQSRQYGLRRYWRRRLRGQIYTRRRSELRHLPGRLR